MKKLTATFDGVDINFTYNDCMGGYVCSTDADLNKLGDLCGMGSFSFNAFVLDGEFMVNTEHFITGEFEYFVADSFGVGGEV